MAYKKTEHDRQVEMVKDIRKLGCVVFAVPNGMALGSGGGRFAYYKKMVKEGVTKGAPDLVVMIKDEIFFIEMKNWNFGLKERIIGQTKQEEEQIEFQKQCEERNIKYFLVDSPYSRDCVIDYITKNM